MAPNEWERRLLSPTSILNRQPCRPGAPGRRITAFPPSICSRLRISEIRDREYLHRIKPIHDKNHSYQHILSIMESVSPLIQRLPDNKGIPMLKKIIPLTAAVAALTVSAFPATASADDSVKQISRYDTYFRPYFGARLGTAITSADSECHHYSVCNLDDDAVFTVHPYVGINVPYTSSGVIGGRFEVEGFFNSKSTYRYDSRDYSNVYHDRLEVSSSGLLINTYVDFYTLDGLVAPYAGVGMGIVWHDADLYSQNRHISDNRNDLAMQVGAGVNFNFNRHVAAELNMRYTSMGRIWNKTYVDDIDLDSLDFMAGLRFTF